VTALASVFPPGPRRAAALALRGLAVGVLAALPGSACHRAELPPNAPAPAHVTIGIPSAAAPVDPLAFSLTHTRLVRMDQGGHARPGVIASWDVAPDRRTWTFRLSPDVRRQDGRLATARDVAALVETARKSPAADPGLWSISRVEVLDDQRLRIHLSRPTSLLLDALALVEALPTGPYREEDKGEGQLPEFEAMRPEGSEQPAIQRVRLRRYDTPRAAVTGLLRGEVDVLYEVPSEARALLAREKSVRSFAHVKPYVVTLGLNHDHPVLAKRAVRQALNAAVDRAALVGEEMEGFGMPAADLLWREHWSSPHTGDAEAIRMDRPRAERLLTSAGLPRRRMADGRELPRLRLHVLVLDDPTMARLATRLRRMYAAIGVDLILQSLPMNQVFARVVKGDFEAFLSPVFTGYGLSRAYLAYADHDRQRLLGRGYRAARQAAEAVREAVDDDSVNRAVKDLHRVVLDDPPDVTLFWQQAERAVGPRVTIADEPQGDVLGSLTRWTVAPEGS
jgi:peptide/nickel transport system substrate-binding protein